MKIPSAQKHLVCDLSCRFVRRKRVDVPFSIETRGELFIRTLNNRGVISLLPCARLDFSLDFVIKKTLATKYAK